MTDQSTPPAPAPSEILSTIVADRACASCGFNLHGQPVTREPHYGLVIARCPECGTVAALQEYPALGPWARRWSFVLAALWVLVLIVVFAGTTMATFGLTAGSIEIASDPAARVLAADYNDWVDQLEEEPRGKLMPSLYGSAGRFDPWDHPDESWPHFDDPGAVFRENGGLWACADRSVAWLWIVMGCVGIPFGVFWGLALMHQKPWRPALVPLVAVLIAGALTVALVRTGMSTPHSFDELSRIVYASWIAPITLGVMLTSMSVWCLLSLPLARLVVRLALPPRLRVPFGVLWTSAGRPPPRPR